MPADRGSSVTPLKEAASAELDAMRENVSDGYPAPPEMKVTREQMKAAQLPINFRDYCAHLLIPLNDCRKKSFYWPFSCSDLRHAYEKCEFDEYERREMIHRMKKKEGLA
mmetsp:Transcript_18512/g.39863  ORF Transcript_18512/g.39863 Transcript_18512/m.39863 type:complete len:110 (-) Transcript_18512:525-854(-)|eukprot:CAMPEP_0183335270 /NCGR_PEP_ID=MMETSP0164_2-20130417/3625_1 /TAXON_ID=221442 /ORGANISM="Coccolithus pelagicus ssp braarudi, Strain PLY182g" /LENGTH=109 /DNA_ID=CAMNT_0025504607 /DNA_START=68 /DNA_END=397 /DNA_ORIENTATION=-